MTSELADPDALISSGKSLLNLMPQTATATAELLRNRNSLKAKDARQTERLRAWFAWIGERVGNGQLVSHCVTEQELRAAWVETKSA